MGKTKKRPGKEQRDPLADPMRAFELGDYVTARAQFSAAGEDQRLTDAERETAADLAAATRLDRTTLYVGLACVVLFLVAVSLTALVQP